MRGRRLLRKIKGRFLNLKGFSFCGAAYGRRPAAFKRLPGPTRARLKPGDRFTAMTLGQTHPIRHDAKELRLLFEVSRLLLEAEKRLSGQLGEVLEILTRHTAFMRGFIAVTSAERFEVAAQIGLGLGKTAPFYRAAEKAAGLVAATGRAMIEPNVSDAPLFITQTNLRELTKAQLAFIYVPIKDEELTLGVLAADRLFAESVPLAEDLRLLTTLAALLARALRARALLKEKNRAVLAENRGREKIVAENRGLPPLLGRSASILAVGDLLRQLAGNDFSVLITGETGTGRELAARHLHALSGRKNSPFIKVSPFTPPDGEFTAALFGAPAWEGTVYLAGLDELPPGRQDGFLAWLQKAAWNGRTGGAGQARSGPRLLASSRLSRATLIETGRLRPELAERLGQFSFSLPPLRDRREDLPIITDYFLRLWSGELGLEPAGLTPEARLLLANYNWPGNIRELSLVVARGVCLAQGGLISPEHLPGLAPFSAPPGQGPLRLPDTLDDLERRLVIEALKAESGHMTKAAARLGLSQRVMGLRLKKYGLDFRTFRRSAKAGPAPAA